CARCPPPDGIEMARDSPFVWRSTAVRLLLAAFPLWSIMAVVMFHTTWQLKLAVGVTAGATLVSPFAGLLGLAVLSPIGAATAGAIRMQQYRLAEMLVMAFLAAWLL